MKRLALISLLILALALSACSGSESASSSPAAIAYTSPNLDTSYEGATSARNQLALGSLKLDGTPQAVSAQQAAELIPLWQGLRGTMQSGGSSQAEINALLGQIEGAMTAEQLGAIREMQLTQTDFQTWMKENGIAMGAGGGQPGAGSQLSPEARATRQAEEGKTSTSTGGASTAIIDAVIVYLESMASRG